MSDDLKGAKDVRDGSSAACVHEWVLIEERHHKHPSYELRSGQHVRRFYCRLCREVVEDKDKEPTSAR